MTARPSLDAPEHKSYQIAGLATVSFAPGKAADYAGMRAGQLHSLALLTSSAEFEDWTEAVKSDARWLLVTLAEEMEGLIQVLHDEACDAKTGGAA
ncbi:hypothetical protein [Massilia sp. CCM 8734]|uniref:hypothetical protein n=1 Tax=Massilia sp. CCM 8734 TaxID=2609283 RepID=UPI0014249A13|nr:hypothetical protein [Massilia sp. CCM 8734]NHZ98077.1 hypothetical protein [Massilia sp. CCM 8734]